MKEDVSGNGDRKSGTGAFIGYDISDRFAQISFDAVGADKPETLTQVMGESSTGLSWVPRRTDRTKWTYGREALKNAAAGDGILVENLLSKALAGESVEVDGESYEGAVLLFRLSNGASLLAGAIRKKRHVPFYVGKRYRPWRC